MKLQKGFTLAELSFVGVLIVWASLVAGIAWVVIHFVRKFW